MTANLLLLTGDFAATDRPSRPLAALLVAGYAGLATRFGWVGLLLLGEG